MMNTNQRQTLLASKRTFFGKRAKQLRYNGILPGNIYGPGRSSLGVEVPMKPFGLVFAESGESTLIDLQLDKETIPVLIKDVAVDPVTQSFLHVDFYAVNLKEKVTVTVPLELMGEPPAVKNSIGVLIHLLNELEVESLPDKIPAKLLVKVDKLEQVDDAVTVKDIEVPEGVSILADATELVCKIEDLTQAEPVEPEPAVVPEVEGEAVEGEGETPAETEGEGPPDEETAEKQ